MFSSILSLNVILFFASDARNYRNFYFKIENAVNSTAKYTINMFLANCKPKMSGYIFSGMLSTNMKLFFASEAPNYRNVYLKLENAVNCTANFTATVLGEESVEKNVLNCAEFENPISFGSCHATIIIMDIFSFGMPQCYNIPLFYTKCQTKKSLASYHYHIGVVA